MRESNKPSLTFFLFIVCSFIILYGDNPWNSEGLNSLKKLWLVVYPNIYAELVPPKADICETLSIVWSYVFTIPLSITMVSLISDWFKICILSDKNDWSHTWGLTTYLPSRFWLEMSDARGSMFMAYFLSVSEISCLRSFSLWLLSSFFTSKLGSSETSLGKCGTKILDLMLALPLPARGTTLLNSSFAGEARLEISYSVSISLKVPRLKVG